MVYTHFENVYVYSKSLFQPKYRYLEELLESINGIGYYAFSNNRDVILYHRRKHFPIQYSYSMMWLVIIRILLENIFLWVDIQTLIVFISVTYAKIPKHLIRAFDNANFLILFKQDGTNLKHIYNDHVNTDILYENFCTLCHLCWYKIHLW